MLLQVSFIISSIHCELCATKL